MNTYLTASHHQETVTIAELSALITRNSTGNRPTDETPTIAMFSELKPMQVNLENAVALMQQHGYSVGQPVRTYPARKRWHAEWHMHVQGPSGEATLAFLVPLDAA